MGEIRSKSCEGVGITWESIAACQLAVRGVRASRLIVWPLNGWRIVSATRVRPIWDIIGSASGGTEHGPCRKYPSNLPKYWKISVKFP